MGKNRAQRTLLWSTPTGDKGDNYYLQCSGVRCQVSASEADPLDGCR